MYHRSNFSPGSSVGIRICVVQRLLLGTEPYLGWTVVLLVVSTHPRPCVVLLHAYVFVSCVTQRSLHWLCMTKACLEFLPAAY